MAALFVVFFVQVIGGALADFTADLPDVLLNATSPLDESSARFLKTQLDHGLVLNTPQVCESLGFFCHPAGWDMNSHVDSQSNLIAKENPFSVHVTDHKSQPNLILWHSAAELRENPFNAAHSEQPNLIAWHSAHVTEHRQGYHSSMPRKALAPSEKESLLGGLVFRISTLKSGSFMVMPSNGEKHIRNKFVHPLLRDSMPFRSENLPQVMKIFNIPDTSPMAMSMRVAISVKPVNDDVEMMTMVTSIDDMVEFARGALCKGLSDCHLKSTSQSTEVNYATTVKVLAVEELANVVTACHTLAFPYKVYGCHRIIESSVFKVTLDQGGKISTAPVICHMSTSKFNPDHPGFIDLNMKPGEGEICHWSVYGDVIWYV